MTTYVRRFTSLAVGCAAAALLPAFSASAEAKKDFTVCWTIYAGWMPWGYAADSGIVKKWADKYGITIKVTQVGDYVECINQFTAGKFDAATSTTMDALAIPSVGGVDTTVLIAGDYSNGNDGIILKDKTSLADVKGQKVNLLELSVSHYFLARALSTVGLTEKDITIVNTSDADWISAYKTGDVSAIVAWNPALAAIDGEKNANLVFDSSKLPGEIVDALIANTATLKDNPALGKALTGAWFETLAVMAKKDDTAKAALESMAKASGTDLAGFEAQLATTKLFTTPAEAYAFVTDPSDKQKFDYVRKFSFEKGLFGQSAKSVDDIGIEFADGSVLGSKDNIKLRFDASYKKMAVDGKL
ncbi:MAG: putative urea ABC transporter substrate-binding protein [Hyphomicrobium sp.]|nr:putative urea ABC transporter substrate-binding protein [Hyphomicrobium sp.]